MIGGRLIQISLKTKCKIFTIWEIMFQCFHNNNSKLKIKEISLPCNQMEMFHKLHLVKDYLCIHKMWYELIHSHNLMGEREDTLTKSTGMVKKEMKWDQMKKKRRNLKERVKVIKKASEGLIKKKIKRKPKQYLKLKRLEFKI